MSPYPHEAVARSAPTAAVVAAAAWALGSVVVVLIQPSEPVTSYAAASAALLVLGAAAGIALVAAGSLGLLVARRGHLGALALLTGVAWLAPAWVGWEEAPSALQALALLLAPMLASLLVHLTTLDARGRVASSWDRWLVVAAYTVVGVLVLARAVVYDPLRDRDCWVGCHSDGNPWQLASQPSVARILGTGLLVATVVLAVVAAIRAVVRVLPGPAGLLEPAVTVSAGLALLGEAAYALVLLSDRTERFDSLPGTVVYVLRAAALLALAVGIAGATAWRLQAARRRVRALAAGLGDGLRPGELDVSLARSLRDDSLEIRYWIEGSEDLVDAAGRRAPIAADDARSTVTVARAQQPVATVLHDPLGVSSEELEASLGPLTCLVIDNERLNASTAAHLAELQESRSRIVAAGDDLRRSVERDLHDGAQQMLLAAGYELGLARADVTEAGPHELAALDRTVDATSAALQALREFAHGVFPAVLDEAGLEAALFSLADGAAVPVQLEVAGLAGVAGAESRAAYVVVRATLESALAGPSVDVSVVRQGGVVVVEVSGGGPVDETRLADRVGSVGGELTVAEGLVRVVIPCAS